MLTLTDRIKFYESVFGSGRLARNAKNFDVRCPICDPKDQSKKKLAILVEEGKCHCWSCGFRARTLAPLIRKYGTYEQLLDYRSRFMEDYQRSWGFDEALEKQPEKLKLPEDFKLLATTSVSDPNVLALRKYLTSRDVDDHDLWYYRLGYSNHPTWFRRVIMPSFDKNGELNYYVGRTVDRFKKPKYENPEIDRLPIVFNELNIDWSKRLVLCEGPFDLMKCGENATALLGSDLNESSALFNALIINETPVALALDADMRTTKTPKIVKKLQEYKIDIKVVTISTDPGDMSKDEFKDALDAAEQLTWDDVFRERLEKASRLVL